MKASNKDEFTKQWIIKHSLEIIKQYQKGILTLRGLHYRLVAAGMTNTIQHYKRVINAMIDARWDNLIDFDVFSDNDRAMIGDTASEETNVDEAIEKAKEQLRLWMTSYKKNKWENQPWYPEVFIEKKALQGVFQSPCFRNQVALGACKGYPSLTFLYESSIRFKYAIRQGKKPIILYFGDYDPSGEDIPRSIQENLEKFGCYDIEVRRIALMENQVIKWKLPPAPVKEGDSRSANWDGLGQVELDAVAPEKLQKLCTEAIESIFDHDLYNELLISEDQERITYKTDLQKYVTEELS